MEFSPEKRLEAAPGLEQTYLEAGLSPDDAAFLAGFSEEQRRACVRKIDWRLCPVLMLLYLISYIDKASIGNAKIEGMLPDLNMTGTDYNVALAIFFIPYTLLEVPSNILLAKFTRPSVYLTILVFCWGTIVTLTGVVQNFGGLCAVRVLLGIFESGFFPGAVWLITQWYLPQETQSRIGVFYTASALAGAFSGLLAFGLAKMDGVAGYSGWRWIFIIEGLATVLLAAFCYFCLPDSPSLSTGWLSQDEIRYLALRKQALRGITVVDEKPNKFDWKTLFTVLTDWHLYLQILNFWSNTVPNYGLKFSLPQIMKNMGYTSANAQLLSMPPYIAGAISAYLFGILADKLRWRMPIIVFGQILVIIGFGILFSLAEDIQDAIPACYFATVLACTGLYPIIPGTNAWTSNNLAGARKQSMGIAFMISVGNLGGLVGSFIYLEREAPKYPTGFGSSFGFAAAGVVASLVLEARFWVVNRRNEGVGREEVLERYSAEEVQRMGDRSPLFRYML
ncbi:major facilitator superfamily domain-containing protein [Aspergillus karnatakaensis]|uniref:major facilitator superfamily domain-containing protein n=1 Tax=Aspergillus karnatakaensis TaxID=1810916 RepID=UPI003CCCFD57